MKRLDKQEIVFGLGGFALLTANCLVDANGLFRYSLHSIVLHVLVSLVVACVVIPILFIFREGKETRANSDLKGCEEEGWNEESI